MSSKNVEDIDMKTLNKFLSFMGNVVLGSFIAIAFVAMATMGS